MCGIAVLCGQGASLDVLQRMALVAERRGPEGLRTARAGDCLLAHTALRFVEPGHNEQPHVADGCALVWNGEIYNWRELAPGAPNDTSALLASLRAHGAACLPRIDGQFAFVARLGETLWIGRDKWGICPLVFGYTPEGWLAIGSTAEVIEAAGVSVVKTLPAGTLGVVTGNRVALHAWYRLPRTDPAPPRSLDADAVREFAQERVHSRMFGDARELFTTMGGMDSQFVTACVARRTRGAFGGAITVVPRSAAEPGGDYPYASATLQRLAGEGIAVPHHVVPLTLAHVEENVSRLLKLLGPDLFQLLCALGDDLVAATVKRLGGRAILTAGGPDEAGRSYDRWTFVHRGLDQELAWHRLCEQFSSSEGVRAGLVFGEHGIENRVPLADLIELAVRIRAEDKQRVEIPAGSDNLASLRMDGKIFWRRALRGVLPDACREAQKEPIHSSIGALPLVAELARRDAVYQRYRREFALYAYWLGWNGIVFADLRELDPRDEIAECQLYALYRWSLVEPRLFVCGGEHRYGRYVDYIPRSADAPEERVHKPLCYDWQVGVDVPIRPVV